jgi:hypothetical protein
VVFVLLAAEASAGWLYGPDISLLRAAQNWPSALLDVALFLSALGSLEIAGALLLVLATALSLGARRRLA